MIPAPRARTILPLALPAVAGTLFEPLLGVIDVAMLGHKGPATLAAVGACAFAFMSAMNLAVGLGQGTQALCARAIGAGSLEDAGAIARRSVRLTFFTGCALLVLIVLCAPTIANAICADEESARLGTQYLRLRALGAPFGAMVASWRGIHLAKRNAFRVMIVMGCGALVHIALNLVMIPRAPLFGGVVEPLGAAALSSAAASITACLVFFAMGMPFPRSSVVTRSSAILRMGAPPAIQGLLTALGYAAFVGALGVGGAEVQGTATVLINLAAFAYLVAMGMATAANTLVAQHLGARDPAGAMRSVSVVIRLSVTLAGPLLLVCLLAPGVAVSLMNVSPSVATLAAIALPYLALGVLADQAGVVLMLSMVAAGKGGVVAATQLGLHWLVLVPGAWWLANHGLAIPGSIVLFAGYRVAVALIMIVLARRTLR